jgi:HK97 family phage major capsid protein
MGNLTNLTDFLAREVSQEIITNVYGASRVFQASTETKIGHGGIKIPMLAKAEAGIVSTRGGAKPVSEPATTNVAIDAVEYAVIVPFSEDLLDEIPAAAADIAAGAIDAIAQAIDVTVFTGVDPKGTSAPANFGNFGGLTPVEVTNASDWYSVLAGTLVGGRSADYAIISKALLYKFWAARTSLNAGLFSITGDVNSGTIEGIPYVTFESSNPIGYVGAFKSGSRYGQVGDLRFKMLHETTLTTAGGTLNLAESNHMAVRVSGSFGFNFFNAGNFKAITSTGLGS